MRDTRGALERWNARSVAGAAGVGRRRADRRLGAAVRGLGGRRALDRPTSPRSASPGVTEDAELGDIGQILFRNSLVLALHAFACVAGFIAGSSLVLSAERRTRALEARPREGAADRLRLGRAGHLLLARHPGLRARAHRRPARRAARDLARRPRADDPPARDPRAGRALPAARRVGDRQPPQRVARPARRDLRHGRDRDPGPGRRRDLGDLRLAADPGRRLAVLPEPARLRLAGSVSPSRARRKTRSSSSNRKPQRWRRSSSVRRLVSRIAWRGSAAIRSASASARSTTSPSATSRTIPSRWASARRDDPAGEAELLGDRRRQHRPRGRVAGRDPARQLRVAEARAGRTATRRSQSSESAKPPASAGPLTAATTGRRQSPTAWKATVLVSTSRSRLCAVAAELARVHARAEGAAGAGEDDAADRRRRPRARRRPRRARSAARSRARCASRGGAG